MGKVALTCKACGLVVGMARNPQGDGWCIHVAAEETDEGWQCASCTAATEETETVRGDEDEDSQG